MTIKMAHPHSNLVRQVDNLEINISSLAAVTGILGASKIDAARENGFKSLVQKGIIALDGSVVTAPTGQPIMVGLTRLNLANLEVAIENDPQNSLPVNQEDAKKFYWILGYLNTYDASSEGSTFKFSTRHKITVIEGTALQFFAYNIDTVTGIPATSQLKIFCEHLGVWLRD